MFIFWRIEIIWFVYLLYLPITAWLFHYLLFIQTYDIHGYSGYSCRGVDDNDDKYYAGTRICGDAYAGMHNVRRCKITLL